MAVRYHNGTLISENVKDGNVDNTNVAHLVTLVRNDPKGALVDGTSDTGDGVGGVLASVALLHLL